MLALVHGLTFVSRDTRGHTPRFPLEPCNSAPPAERLAAGTAASSTPATPTPPSGSWPRPWPDCRPARWRPSWERPPPTTSSSTAATPSTSPTRPSRCSTTRAGTHAADRAAHPGASRPPTRPGPRRAEPGATPTTWPTCSGGRGRAGRPRGRTGHRTFAGDEDVDALAWTILGDDPAEIVGALDRADDAGATVEELARAVAYAAALRVTRFHTQNDHGDWDVVHHGFTAANAVHQLVGRAPTPGAGPGRLPRGPEGVPRPLPQRPRRPATRPPPASRRRAELERPRRLLGSAGPGRRSRRHRVRMAARRRLPARRSWRRSARPSCTRTPSSTGSRCTRPPSASRPPGRRAPSRHALILAGTARFLAAHTPTRRELPQVVRIATRLRRGEPLYELRPRASPGAPRRA